MYSSLLNNEESLNKTKKFYKDYNLLFTYDIWKIDTYDYLSVIISYGLSKLKGLQLSQIFLHKYLISNPNQEYIKAMSLIPLEYLIDNYENDLIYFNKDELDIGCGVILNINENDLKNNNSIDLNFKEHFKYFIIKDDEVINIDIFDKFKYTTFMTNCDNECLLMLISNNVIINENLLININKQYPFLNLDILLKEEVNEKEINKQFTIDRYVINSRCIENIIQIEPILFFSKGREYNFKLLECMFDKIFNEIFKYLDYDLISYITNDQELINQVKDINIEWNNEYIYLINTNNTFLKTLIKCILKSNNYKFDNLDYIICNKNHPSLSDLLDITTFKNTLNQEIIKIKKNIKNILNQIYDYIEN